MKRWKSTVGTLVVVLALIVAPASLAAAEDVKSLNQSSSEVFHAAGSAGGAVVGSALSLELSVGFKGGIGAVAGYGFDNHAQVSDSDGTTLNFPSNAHNPWVYPEYYGHFGLGPAGGMSLELRFRGLVGFETGLMYSRDNASGYVDKNHASSGTTIARINSQQTTTAYHIPMILKLVMPGIVVRPFIGAGLQLVLQASSELEYEQEQRAGQYGGSGAMDELNRRNTIEESNYPLLVAAAGVEFALAGIKIPIELRVGYALGVSREMEERARYDASQDQIIYDGVYMGHVAIFTGVLYEFDL